MNSRYFLTPLFFLFAFFVSGFLVYLFTRSHRVTTLAMLCSLIAVVYVGKILEALYFKSPANDMPAVKEAPLLLLVPTWALVLANVYFGLDTDFSVGMAERAVEALGVIAK